MAQNKSKKTRKRKVEERELKFKRIELVIGIVSVLLAIATFVNSVANVDYQKKIDYNKNMPNLSMVTEIVVDDETGNETTKCVIKNDGGTIREAKMTPHLYFRYLNAPSIYAKYQDIYVVEILDMFAPWFIEDWYATRCIAYNPDDCSWVIEVDKEKIKSTWELLLMIGSRLEGDVVFSEYVFLLEVNYIDIMGERRTEWYDGIYGLLTGIEGINIEWTTPGFPYQLECLDEKSSIPLSVYCNAPGISLGTDIEKAKEDVDYLVEICQAGLCQD